MPLAPLSQICQSQQIGEIVETSRVHIVIDCFNFFCILPHCLSVHFAGVSINRYISISILIKHSNFNRFYKKLGPFYKKLRCEKFSN